MSGTPSPGRGASSAPCLCTNRDPHAPMHHPGHTCDQAATSGSTGHMRPPHHLHRPALTAWREHGWLDYPHKRHTARETLIQQWISKDIVLVHDIIKFYEKITSYGFVSNACYMVRQNAFSFFLSGRKLEFTGEIHRFHMVA